MPPVSAARNCVPLLLRPAPGGSSQCRLHRFRLPSPQQRRSYLLLYTTLNPKDTPQLPANLPVPPKTIILLTGVSAATGLTTPALSPLTNDSTATLLSAAVDSLPGSGNLARATGHSWLITDHPLPIRIPSQKANSLTFSLPTTSFTIPLANTVFQNGQTSTLVHLPATAHPAVIEAAVEVSDSEVEEFAHAQEDIKEAWEELGHLMKMVGVKSGIVPHMPIPPDSVEIQISEDVLKDGRGSGKIFTELPLKALTRPRKIGEGMGNILRELETPEGTPPGASRELEVAVANYLDSLSKDGDTPERVNVFARLTTQEPPLNPTELLLYPGARLHRVLSGGGGWGSKAGLLSLDPQGERNIPRFEQEFEARYNGTEAEHEGIVQKGEWVQFFAVESPVRTTTATGLRFGAVGKEENIVPTEAVHGREVAVEGCFGGSSELGVDIGFAGRSRRMDVPGGAVVVDA